MTSLPPAIWKQGLGGVLVIGYGTLLCPDDRCESAYDRLEVEAWAFGSGEPMGPGHVYVSRPDARWIERDPVMLLPLWRDVVWARNGAHRISRRFGETFDRTTYLADGLTLVADRYRDHFSASV